MDKLPVSLLLYCKLSASTLDRRCEMARKLVSFSESNRKNTNRTDMQGCIVQLKNNHLGLSRVLPLCKALQILLWFVPGTLKNLKEK